MATSELEVVVLVPKHYLDTFEKFIKETQLTPGMMEVKMYLRAILGAHQAQLRGHVTTIFRDELTSAIPLFPGTQPFYGTKVSTVLKSDVQRMRTENMQIQQQRRDQTLYKEEQKQYNRQLTINTLSTQPPNLEDRSTQHSS